MKFNNLLLYLAVVAGATMPLMASAGTIRSSQDQEGVLSNIRQDAFYVGGKYLEDSDSTHMVGQMYVESWQHSEPKNQYPVVFIHGLGQTGFTWTSTPDGRDGWADHFLAAGYDVYMVDQPSRGRSPRFPDDSAVRTSPVELVQRLFTAPKQFGTWPQASNHSQWPGDGVAGDEVFDNFYRSIVPSLSSNKASEILVRDAVSLLLDKIGPAIILVHSQAGLFGWSIADSRSHLVKAVIAIEPSGPSFMNATKSERELPWGLTNIPVAYEPAVIDPDEIEIVLEDKTEDTQLVNCWLQREPARKLINLKNIPVLIVTGEASYHAPYDHCSAKFLKQAGVPVSFWRLEEKGIHGNGHLMMLEKNNHQISSLLIDWIATINME